MSIYRQLKRRLVESSITLLLASNLTMLPISNLMGRQMGCNCLTVDELFINGQIVIECLGAESGDRPQFLISQAKTVQDWSTGYDWL